MTDQPWSQLEARAFNAVQPALREAGEWLPLTARRKIAQAVLAEIIGPIDSGTNTATWTAVRAIQLMNEAGRQRDQAQAAIARLRQLHQRDGDYCATCTEDFGRLQAEWPCPTIRTLDEPPAHNAGPTVAEAAADDRRWWTDKYAGEGQ